MGRPIVAIILFASLAANVFLGGYLAGRWTGGPKDPGGAHDRPPPPSRGGDAGIGAVIAADPALREKIRAEVRQRRPAMRRGFREQRALQTELAEALSAEPFDRARIEAAFEAMSSASLARNKERFSIMLDVLEDLPADERAALVETMRERWRDRRGHRGGERGGKERRFKHRGPPPADAPLDAPLDAPVDAPEKAPDDAASDSD